MERVVLSLLGERLAGCFRSRADRLWYAALAASSALHVALFVVLAWLWVAGPGEPGSLAVLDSRWQPEDAAEPLVEIDRPPAEAVEPTEGGREAALPVAAALEVPVVFPTVAALEAADLDGERMLRESLAAEVGAAPGAAASGEGGQGAGRGTGDGAGQGRGFFGAEGRGRRFVYVVDRSGSMNHPHASEWKTRFRRLKFELLTSIGQMTPDMQFYIVFFNEHPTPMPAAELQPATPAAKHEFLEWMARMRAGGQTDPRAALDAALGLKPDTIYFLSDGAFSARIEADLKSIRQREVVIHTFALGNAGGRETLEWIAASNGGTFHFVP